ncbi:MAG TPA: MMPL family transporter [Streptosporangiaceae bacterium]|nr:MMPL family transporter [Streptosporangiaceae bacterium]
MTATQIAQETTPHGAVRRPAVERVAGWSVRHRKTAVIGWLLLIVAAVFGGNAVKSAHVHNYDPGEAGRAERVLDRPGIVQHATENVLIRDANGTWSSDPAMRAAAQRVVASLRKVPQAATNIQSPFGSGKNRIADGGHAALISFTVPGKADDADTTFVPARDAVARVAAAPGHQGLTIEEAGSASLNKQVGSAVSHDFRKAEVTSVPITLGLLLLVFGALIAAGIPLLLAGSAVIAAISLLTIPGHWLPVSQTTSSIVLLVGMAVGIDYSLFYLRRVREERAHGHDTNTALHTAARTSGQAILVSGLTVMASLAGLFFTGLDVFSGAAIGTIFVVGIAVLGSVTVLPALLSMLGTWTDRARIPWLGKRRAAALPSRGWTALAHAVIKKPLLTGALAVAALGALAVPALSMRLQDPGIHELPASVPVIRTLLDINQAFPGGPVPAEVVVTGTGLESPTMAQAITSLRDEARHSHGAIGEPITTESLAGGKVMVIDVPLAGDATNATSVSALGTLRTDILPATLGKVPGISYAVGGDTAGNHDWDAVLTSRLPLVFGFVLGLAFLLLMITFRSVAVPLLSIALNLLSVGAAYGLLVMIFQNGHFQSALGFTAYGGITSWLPMFMFVLLFGLSMDYHVFILSRIRELRQRGLSAREAIAGGIGSSAGVVTSAAAIMVAVFSIFATLSAVEFKMFGVGMAAAVLIDATVVRGVLLPAGLSLLGDRLWRPRSLPRA